MLPGEPTSGDLTRLRCQVAGCTVRVLTADYDEDYPPACPTHPKASLTPAP